MTPKINDKKYKVRFAWFPVRIYDTEWNGWIWLRPYFIEYRYMKRTWIDGSVCWCYQGTITNLIIKNQ